MAKTEIESYDGPDPRYQGRRQVKVTVSRRNLLSLLHKLDMEGSNRRIENNVFYIDGDLDDDHVLVLCCEDDEEHYADPDRLGSRAGAMHPDTESYVRAHTQ